MGRFLQLPSYDWFDRPGWRSDTLHRMKNIAFLGVGTLVLVLLGAYIAGQISGQRDGNNAPVIGAMDEYTSAAMGLHISHPKSWTIQEEGKGVYFLSPKENSADTMRENINVLVEDISGNTVTLQEYAVSAMEQVKTLSNYEVVSEGKPRIGTLPAYSIVYTATIDNHSVQFQQAWTVQGKKAYLITLAASPATFPTYTRVFGRMIKSFGLDKS